MVNSLFSYVLDGNGRARRRSARTPFQTNRRVQSYRQQLVLTHTTGTRDDYPAPNEILLRRGLRQGNEAQAQDTSERTLKMFKKVHYIPSALVYKSVCGVDLVGLTGVSSTIAGYNSEPGEVRGCEVCLEAAAEDLADVDWEHSSRCRYCGQTISATGGVAWRRAIHSPCPKCQRDGWYPIIR